MTALGRVGRTLWLCLMLSAPTGRAAWMGAPAATLRATGRVRADPHAVLSPLPSGDFSDHESAQRRPRRRASAPLPPVNKPPPSIADGFVLGRESVEAALAVTSITA